MKGNLMIKGLCESISIQVLERLIEETKWHIEFNARKAQEYEETLIALEARKKYLEGKDE